MDSWTYIAENGLKRGSLGLRRNSDNQRFPNEIASEPGRVEYLRVHEDTLGNEKSLNKVLKKDKAKACLDHEKGSSLAKCGAQSR